PVSDSPIYTDKSLYEEHYGSPCPARPQARCAAAGGITPNRAPSAAIELVSDQMFVGGQHRHRDAHRHITTVVADADVDHDRRAELQLEPLRFLLIGHPRPDVVHDAHLRMTQLLQHAVGAALDVARPGDLRVGHQVPREVGVVGVVGLAVHEPQATPDHGELSVGQFQPAGDLLDRGYGPHLDVLAGLAAFLRDGVGEGLAQLS